MFYVKRIDGGDGGGGNSAVKQKIHLHIIAYTQANTLRLIIIVWFASIVYEISIEPCAQFYGNSGGRAEI